MDQNKIWEYYQGNDDIYFSRNYKRINWLVKRSLQITSSNDSILNIGTGNGLFELSIQSHRNNIYSLDPDINTLERLKEKAPIHTISGKIEEAQITDDGFDLIVASEIFEHLDLKTLNIALEKIHKALKKGGTLLGTVPFAEQLAENMVICPKCSETFHRWGHNTTFTKEGLAQLIKAYFPTVNIKLKIFTPWKKLNWRGKTASFFRNILFSLGLTVTGIKLVFRAEK